MSQSEATPIGEGTPTGEEVNVTDIVDTSGQGIIPDYGILPDTIPDWFIDLSSTLLVIALTWVSARVLTSLLGRRIARWFDRPSLTRTVLRAIRTAVYLVGFFTVLGIYGLSLGDIALSVTVFTAVVGVVLAPILGSYISGLFLLADQPYEIGDMVEIVDEGHRGFVEDITLRYTKIRTLDNTFVVVPNGEIRSRDVINYSAEDPRTRQTLDVVVTYEGDLAKARSIVERAARSVDVVIEGGPDIRIGAARYPATPTCYVQTFGDHGVHLRLRYWLKEPYKLLATRSRIQGEIWDRLADANVEIAYPHQHHVFDETSGRVEVALGDRAEGERGPDRRPDVPSEPVDNPGGTSRDGGSDGG